MPTQEQVHLCLIRDMGIFWLLRESVPLCLLGDMAIFITLGSVALSAYCQPTQGHGHPLAPWGQEPSLPLLPSWGHGHLLALWGKIIYASTGTCTSSGCSGTRSSACFGTWPLSTAWGQECSLLTASLLGNMAIIWIPGDQITLPCGDRIPENLLGNKNISAGSGKWASPGGRGPALHSGGHGNLLAPWGQGGLCLLRNTDTLPCLGTEAPSTWDISCRPGNKITFTCLGDKDPDYTSGDKITVCLGTWASPGSLETGGLTMPLLWHPAGQASPSSGTTDALR